MQWTDVHEVLLRTAARSRDAIVLEIGTPIQGVPMTYELVPATSTGPRRTCRRIDSMGGTGSPWGSAPCGAAASSCTVELRTRDSLTSAETDQRRKRAGSRRHAIQLHQRAGGIPFGTTTVPRRQVADN